VGGHEGYINVGMFEDGRPGELFITMAKEGSTVGGLMDAFGTAISMSLQYGVPLSDLVNKFSHMRFEPMGHTTNPDIRIAKSVIDYIFRWMGIRFLPGYKEANSGLAKMPQAFEDDEASARSPAATKASGLAAGQGTTAATAASKAEVKAVLAAPATNGHTNGAPRKAVSEPTLRIDGNGGPASGDALSLRSEQFARFQLDAPSCDNCGAITVRNGNCYLCHNCGNSMGCS
jgi:ribonucleoside-diphosphate reductase alpha chain